MYYLSLQRCMALYLMFLCILACTPMFGQSKPTNAIRVNQVGYLTQCPKLAMVKVGHKLRLHNFSILSIDRKQLYYEGSLKDSMYWDAARDTIKRADFTQFNVPGKYVLEVAGLGYSYPFEIKSHIYQDLNVDALRYFYLNRASTSIPSAYGGVYARAAGHIDTNVMVHSSAATAQRPAGSKVKVSKGWYDAGDYGCYTTNAGISTYTLMLSYDLYKSYFDTLKLNIPESSNTIPDILDEVKWNLDWLLSMQDPSDGGVYFKKVSLYFPPFILPKDDNSERYVINKSTQSALDFVAVMSYAARLYKKYDPEYANTCLTSAIKAYQWAVANPSKLITRNTSDDFSGGYTDGNPNDEFFWSKAELYITTKDDIYLPAVPTSFPIANWQNVGVLGCYSLLHNRDSLTDLGKGSLAKVETIVLNLAAVRETSYATSAYKTLILPGDFYWGSNSVHLNALMNHYFAQRISKKQEYIEAISNSFEYILGRNPLAMSFITKYGVHSPQNPHHRISISSKILPGMVVGGSNPQNTNDCVPNTYAFEDSYVTRLAPLCYFDDICSYSTNETAINWNAPLVFVVSTLLNEFECKDTMIKYTEIKNLTLLKEQCEVVINFETDYEESIDHYTIEKSLDNINFTKLVEISNNHSGTYTYKDSNIGLNKVYYKVWSSTDIAGARVYSNSGVASLDFTPKYLNVYPIPVQDVVHIDIPCYTQGSFKVHDNMGRKVFEGELLAATNVLNVQEWASGTYIFTFKIGQEQYKRRVMVK